MRITTDKYVRRWLADKRLGNKKVKEIIMNGKRIWPTKRATVYSCVLDVNELVGSKDWAYWLHALDAVAKLGAASHCHIRLTAGGREYMLGATFGVFNLAEFDGRATVVFGDNGPLAEKLAVGDFVEVRLRVPEREGAFVTADVNRSDEETVSAQWLSGTRLQVKVTKYKAKQSAGCYFSVVGKPSGTEHIIGQAQKNGHDRGTYYGTVYARSGRVINGRVWSYNDEVVPGDYGLTVRGDWYNSGAGHVRLTFPMFAKQLRFKVSAVTRHG